MKILVVDDDQFCLSLTCKFLGDSDHTVVTAAGVDEAIEILDGSDDIDLLITDIIMPDRLGIELITHVKKSKRPIPVIAVTGGYENAVEDYVVQAEMFADVAMSKPLYRDVLIDAVNALQ